MLPPIDQQRRFPAGHGDTLLRLIDELAAVGATDDGGVSRPALSETDRTARRMLVDRARSLGLNVERDAIGNMYATMQGTTDAPPVATGSHIDSQPTGGRLDGAYGVCAGLHALKLLADAGTQPPTSIELVIWTNEEGSRFQPGTMGSAAFAEPTLLDTFMTSTDADGVTVRDELASLDAQFADVPIRPVGTRYGAFLELHIEQGPTLEHSESDIGIVTGVQGCRWYTIRTTGRTAHAGTTPMSMRDDAVAGLLEVLDEPRAWAVDDDLRVTIGSLSSHPASINTVAAEAHATIDLRHPSTRVLDHLEARLRSVGARHGATVDVQMRLEPTEFADSVIAAATDAATSSPYRWQHIRSGAFHDAVHIARTCPTGMIFVPSVGGVSHHPLERTEYRHLIAGAEVLTETLARLATG